MEDQSRIRKRNKPSLSCYNCRKKKVKCDRNLPCSSCEKANMGSTCEYQFRPQSKEKNEGRSKTKESLKVGKNENGLVQRDAGYRYNITVSGYDHINFYDGFTPIVNRSPYIRMNAGPFAWFCVIKKDPWSRSILKGLTSNDIRRNGLSIGHQMVCSNPNNLNTDNLDTDNLDLLGEGETKGERRLSFEEDAFHRRRLKGDGYDEVVPYKILSKSMLLNQKKENLRPQLRSKSLFEGNIESELELIEELKGTMPNKKAIWLLVDRFFESVYPFMPLIDEANFLEKMTKIFGDRSYDDVPLESLKIDRKLDLAHVALTLILFRITYLSLFSNKVDAEDYSLIKTGGSFKKEDLEYLYKITVGSVVIRAAEKIYGTFDTNRRTTRDVFSVAVFLRVYSHLAPEESDFLDGGDSSVSTAILIQKAYSLGFNREPDNFPEFRYDLKLSHMGRKLWQFLVCIDLNLCYINGNTPIIQPKSYDVKAPFYVDGGSNVEDEELEKIVLKALKWSRKLIANLKDVSDLVMDINSRISVNELLSRLDDLEEVCQNHYFIFSDEFRAEMAGVSDRCRRYCESIRTKIFLNVYSSLVIIYHYIFMYYTEKKNLENSFSFVEKSYFIINNCICPLICEVLVGEMSKDGFFINHSVLSAIHKTTLICSSSCLRLKYHVLAMEKGSNHHILRDTDEKYERKYLALVRLYKASRSLVAMFIKVEHILSKRYYYAWRISRAHKLIFDLANDNDYSDLITDKVASLFGFQVEETKLNTLSDHLEEAGRKLGVIFIESDSNIPSSQNKQNTLFTLGSFDDKLHEEKLKKYPLDRNNENNFPHHMPKRANDVLNGTSRSPELKNEGQEAFKGYNNMFFNKDIHETTIMKEKNDNKNAIFNDFSQPSKSDYKTDFQKTYLPNPGIPNVTMSVNGEDERGPASTNEQIPPGFENVQDLFGKNVDIFGDLDILDQHWGIETNGLGSSAMDILFGRDEFL